MNKLTNIIAGVRKYIFERHSIKSSAGQPVRMRFFEVEVVNKQILSPSFIRITFKGDAVKNMVVHAPDQWLKLFIPNEDGSVEKVIGHNQYLKFPDNIRPPMRTYTIRELRSEILEFDIDFVVHGDEGPASRWAISAKIHDKMQIRAHSKSADKTPSGCKWLPPSDAENLYIFADETAMPATLAIIESLAKLKPPPKLTVFIEVPTEEDILTTEKWGQLKLTWLVRNSNDKYGEKLYESSKSIELRNSKENTYFWIAAEKNAVRKIKMHFSQISNINKKSIMHIAYWINS
ncbi:MAG: hypothetical protein COB24_09360 [Hyphomicrobiales bacterium]|nr:MAG: hypothetical protein COB24_09360 [Hyphomicrobiales bacterium]